MSNGKRNSITLINRIIKAARQLKKQDRRTLSERLSSYSGTKREKSKNLPANPFVRPSRNKVKRGVKSGKKSLASSARGSIIPLSNHLTYHQKVKGTSYTHILKSCKTRQQYNMLRGPSISNAKTMRHQPTVMHEFFDNKGIRNCSVTTHLLLFDVTSVSALSPGQRIPGTMMLISPETIGSQLTLLSKQYQSYRLDELEIFYETEVPTTTEGAISLFFTNDTTTNQWLEGMDMKRHAASAPYYMQTPVWQNCGLKIIPTELAKRYWTQASAKDVSFQFLGLLTALAASDLSAAKTFGSVYARLAITFEMPVLSTEVELAPTFGITWEWDSSAVVRNTPVFLNPDVTTQSVTIVPSPPDMTGIYYGVVESNSMGISFRTPEDSRPVTLTLGQGIFVRQWLFEAEFIYGLYADLESAVSAELSFDYATSGHMIPVVNDGMCIYETSSPSVSGALGIALTRFVSLDDTPDVL